MAMAWREYSDLQVPTPNRERLRRGPQFRIATASVVVAAVSAVSALIRFPFPSPSKAIALGVLFAIFVFAEDIRCWLPR